MTLPKITIIGSGNVGTATARLIMLKGLADVVLVDRDGGLPKGRALDLCQEAQLEHQDIQVSGSADYADTADSDIIIITAGIAATTGISREDLLNTNAKIAREVAQKSAAFSPEAIYIVVSNPVDVMCQVVKQAADLPHNRIIGMGGVLDSARLQRLIADELKVSVENTSAMVIGSHGNKMVPLTRFCHVAGIELGKLLDPEKIGSLCRKTVSAGDDIVDLVQSGSAYNAPAASVFKMAEAILKNRQLILPCSAWLEGQYGFSGMFLGVPVKLGAAGIHEIVELDLDQEEKAQLTQSALAVQKLTKSLIFGEATAEAPVQISN